MIMVWTGASDHAAKQEALHRQSQGDGKDQGYQEGHRLGQIPLVHSGPGDVGPQHYHFAVGQVEGLPRFEDQHKA